MDSVPSRVEDILLALINNSEYDGPIISRVEQILYSFLENSEYAAEPESRVEAVLVALKAAGLYNDEVISRIEKILYSKINGTEYTAEPESRVEELLLEWVLSEEKELTGVVPLLFNADGTPLIDYLISGNTVQSGTPSPDNPIQPQGCGNLETNGAKAGQYKIPISSAGQTTPIYLGEVETTRRIRKLVLTGEEGITLHNVRNNIAGVRIPVATVVADSSQLFCSHAINVSGDAYYFARTYNKVATSGVGNDKVYMSAPDSEHNSLSGIISYIEQQYANGTPVTIWYVLAEPETAVVNEPLMKIGDYADTLSMVQAGVEIPTVNGSNTLDVDTTVKPSEVYIKYTESKFKNPIYITIDNRVYITSSNEIYILKR